jgi:hypothetical protein
MAELTPEAWTLNEGDLVIWTGKQSEHSTLKNHIIYQVMSKKLETSPPITPGGTPSEHWRLNLRPAFDFQRPLGVAVNTLSWSDHELRKVTLVDLGVVRLAFDNFIREFARMNGMEDTLAE